MSTRTGRRELTELRARLVGRDLAIVGMVADLRLMSGRQLEAIFFSSEFHDSYDSASRAARRVLARLVEERVLVRLNRQIGGIRAGSRAFVYGLGPVGHRLLERTTSRPRYREPSALFVDHTLAIAQIVVSVINAARQGRCELISWQGEPRCWRTFSSAGGRIMLRPDLYLALGVDEYEHRFFIEVDRDTEHLPSIFRKANLYDRYYRSGREQSKSGLFPTVLFVASDAKRGQAIERGLQAMKKLPPKLFATTCDDDVLEELLGDNS